MSHMGDEHPDYLLREQYRDARNLDARLSIHQRFSTNEYGWHRWVFDRILEGPGGRVLELGCGPGTLWAENRARVPSDWELVLTDFSDGMVAACGEALAKAGLEATLARGDAQSIAQPDDSFDSVVANHMLYHVPDRPRAFAEIRRVLRPGGVLFASTNGNAHLAQIFELRNRHLGMDADVTASRFGLESGEAQLGAVFSRVDCTRYEDSLRVTEVDPVVDFVRSSIPAERLDPRALDALRAHVARQIEVQGAFRVQKDAGIFRARDV